MNYFIEKKISSEKKFVDDWYKKRNLEIPNTILVEFNISYLNYENVDYSIDVYCKKNEKKLPIFFEFHGGELLLGDKKYNQEFCIELAKRGFLVFCINYPLVPVCDIDSILRNSYLGISKSFELISKYNGDINNIFIGGDSAGGFIALYINAIQNNSKLSNLLDIKVCDFKFKGVGLFSPMIYSNKIDKHGIFVLRKYFYGKDSKSVKYSNPECDDILSYVDNLFICTSKGDYLHDYSIKYSKVLEKHNKNFLLFNFNNRKLKHDYIVFEPLCNESQECLDKMNDFFFK